MSRAPIIPLARPRGLTAPLRPRFIGLPVKIETGSVRLSTPTSPAKVSLAASATEAPNATR